MATRIIFSAEKYFADNLINPGKNNSDHAAYALDGCEWIETNYPIGIVTGKNGIKRTVHRDWCEEVNDA